MFTLKYISRGGEWFPEKSWPRKFVFQSRNLGGVLNESWNLVVHLGFSNFWPQGLGVSDFCLLVSSFDQNHDI